MEETNFKSRDSVSETSIYQSARSGTPSTGSCDSLLKATKSENFKKPSGTAILPPIPGPNTSDSYASTRCSRSTDAVPVSATEKTNRDVTSSPISSLRDSSSLETDGGGVTSTTDAVDRPLEAASRLASTETIEIILKQPSKKNVAPLTERQLSTASIDILEESQTETTEHKIKLPFTVKNSMSSLSLGLSGDNSEISVHSKSDSSGGGRTVRFSLQDAAPQHHGIEADFEDESDLLKTSKSMHATRPDDASSEDEDSIESTNLQMGHVFVYMVVPPDGGYGWFICFISFLCQIVIDGTVYSIGILLPHIAKDFNKPGSEVILIASLQTGFYFLSGTVASAFINKYGFRPVAFTGAVLSITFLTLATFSVNLPMMILFHSILGGPALSLVWVSSQLVIGYYFDRYRPIANGAACSGAGAGIMLFSFMNSVLVPDLGWRNLMRLHVVCLVLVLLMTLSFLEVAPTKIGRVKESLAEDTESESLDIFYGLTNYSRFSLKVNNQEYPLDNNFEAMMEKPVTQDEKGVTCCDSCLRKCCPFLKRQRELRAKEEARKRYVIQQDPIERHDLFYSGPKDVEAESPNTEELLQSRLHLSGSRDLEDSRWRVLSLEEIDNAYKRNTIIRRLSSRRIIPDPEPKPYRLTYAQLKVTEERPILALLSPRNWLHPKIQKAFRLLFDFRLLDVMEFRILLLSAFLFPMGFNIPFVYSTVRAQIDTSFAQLITPTIGFSNFAFRIASGFVAFKFREYTTYICGGGMFFGGLAVFVSAFYGLDAVWFQFLYALCYGIAPAFFSTLRAIIYVRALGLDKLTNAFGLTALAMGLGVFIGTTAGGILNDLTGSYTASFIFAGICICAAGALKLLLPCFMKVTKDAGRRK